MLLKVVLLIDKREVLSVKYQKALVKNGFYVLHCDNLIDAHKYMNNLEPEIIILSDSVVEKISCAINDLKKLSNKFRPNIIVLSKSNHLDDKLDALNSGADDYLSEPIDLIEFNARINAHLRRILDNSYDENTKLYNTKISQRMLKRSLLNEQNNAYLLITINNFKYYEEIYGEIASCKMLQTYSAIIGSSIDKNDYFGKIFNNDFILITNFNKAEKIAKYLVYTFDEVIKKFYSQNDINQGFILLNNDIIEESRTDFVTTQIGIILNNDKYKSEKGLLNSLISLVKLSKLKNKSNYIIERPRLCTSNDSISANTYNDRILICEMDDALSLLLDTHFNLQGYSTRVVKSYEEIENNEDFNPGVIILDAGDDIEMKGIEICRKIRNNNKFVNSKIILTTIFHHKQKIFQIGADLYLPKPYELHTILTYVKRFLYDINY